MSLLQEKGIAAKLKKKSGPKGLRLQRARLVYIGAADSGMGDVCRQLKWVVRQRVRPQATRKINMATVSAIRAGQFRDMLGARAETASVMKIVVAASTRM